MVHDGGQHIQQFTAQPVQGKPHHIKVVTVDPRYQCTTLTLDTVTMMTAEETCLLLSYCVYILP